jgi:predicted MFS family arabinose efflux permease
MRISPLDRAKLNKSFIRALVEGWQFAVSTSRIRSALLLLALMSFAGRLYLVLLPVFAAEIIGGGARQLGIMNGTVGLGALAGALCMASMVSTMWLERTMMFSSLVLSVVIIFFAWTTRMPPALILLFTLGVSELMMKVSCNTLLQSLVPEEMRGRIMSLYAMAFRGTAPLGYLIGGLLASHIGSPKTMLLSGVFCLISACWFMVHRRSAGST